MLGLILTMAFLKLFKRPRAILYLILIFLILAAVQLSFLFVFGDPIFGYFYPIHTHVVAILLFRLFFKEPIYRISVVALIEYMCLEFPAYLSKFAIYLPKYNYPVEFILYAILSVITAILAIKYLSDSMYYRLHNSTGRLLYFSIVPLIYYFFDYASTIWSKSLYEGNLPVLETMSLIMCLMCPIFSAFFNSELMQAFETVRYNSAAEARLAILNNEYKTLTEKQKLAQLYRDNMYAHFSTLYELADKGDIDAINDYIKQNITEINNITPKRFCSHDLLNALLSNFSETMEKLQIEYHFNVNPPDDLPLSNTEFCALVSNAIENAIHAMQKLPVGKRKLDVQITERNGMLVFSADNTCSDDVSFENGLPIASEEGHGYGTKSIVRIAELHHGFADFRSEHEVFRLMVTIPLSQTTPTQERRPENE